MQEVWSKFDFFAYRTGEHSEFTHTYLLSFIGTNVNYFITPLLLMGTDKVSDGNIGRIGAICNYVLCISKTRKLSNLKGRLELL